MFYMVIFFTNLDIINASPLDSLHFLDRHYVTCPTNWVLTKFQQRRYGTRINYEYNCCASMVPLSCAKVNSNSVTIASGSRTTLPLVNFYNNAGYQKVMNGFKLNTSGTSFTYQFDSCSFVTNFATS